VLWQLISGILEDTVQFKNENKSELNEEIYAWCCGSSYIWDTGGYCAVQKREKSELNEDILYRVRGVLPPVFLKWPPASTVSPIMTKFSQYTPHSTCYLVLVSICRQD
jgi:hypothetical protein